MRRLTLLVIWVACCMAAPAVLLRQLVCVITNPSKAMAIAIDLDRAGNRAANGGRTETISSRANRARASGRAWGCVLCRFLDWLQPNHCRDSAGI